ADPTGRRPFLASLPDPENRGRTHLMARRLPPRPPSGPRKRPGPGGRPDRRPAGPRPRSAQGGPGPRSQAQGGPGPRPPGPPRPGAGGGPRQRPPRGPARREENRPRLYQAPPSEDAAEGQEGPERLQKYLA